MAAKNKCRFLCKNERDAIERKIESKYIDVYNIGNTTRLITLSEIFGNKDAAIYNMLHMLKAYINNLPEDLESEYESNLDNNDYIDNVLDDMLDSNFRYRDGENIRYTNNIYIPSEDCKGLNHIVDEIKKQFDNNNGVLNRVLYLSLVNHMNRAAQGNGNIGLYLVNHLIRFIPLPDGRYMAIFRKAVPIKFDQYDSNNVTDNIEIQETLNRLNHFFDIQRKRTDFDWKNHRYSINRGIDSLGNPVKEVVLLSVSLLVNSGSISKINHIDAIFGNAFDNIARDLFMHLNNNFFYKDGNENKSLLKDLDLLIRFENEKLIFDDPSEIFLNRIIDRIDSVISTARVNQVQNTERYLSLRVLILKKLSKYYEELRQKAEADGVEYKSPDNNQIQEFLINEIGASDYNFYSNYNPHDWASVFDVDKNGKDNETHIKGTLYDDNMTLYKLQKKNTANNILLMYLGLRLNMYDISGKEDVVFMSGEVDKNGTVTDLPAVTGLVFTSTDDIKGKYTGGTFDMIVIDGNGVPHIIDFKTYGLTRGGIKYDEKGNILWDHPDTRRTLKKIKDNYDIYNRDKYSKLLNFYYLILSIDPYLFSRMSHKDEDGKEYSTTLNILRCPCVKDKNLVDPNKNKRTIVIDDKLFEYYDSYGYVGQKEGKADVFNEEHRIRSSTFVGFEPQPYYSPKTNNENELQLDEQLELIINHTDDSDGKRYGKSVRDRVRQITAGNTQKYISKMNHTEKIPVVQHYVHTQARLNLRNLQISSEATVAIGKMIAIEFVEQLNSLEESLKVINQFKVNYIYSENDEVNGFELKDVPEEQQQRVNDALKKMKSVFYTLDSQLAFLKCKDRGSLIEGNKEDKRHKGSILRPFIFTAVRRALLNTLRENINNDEERRQRTLEYIENNYLSQNKDNIQNTYLSSLKDSVSSTIGNALNEKKNAYLSLFEDIENEDGIVVSSPEYEYFQSFALRKISDLENLTIRYKTRFDSNGSTVIGDSASSINEESESEDVLNDSDENVVAREQASTQWGVGNEEKNPRNSLSVIVKRKLDSLIDTVNSDEIIRNPILYFLGDRKTCDSGKLTTILIDHISNCGDKASMANKIKELGEEGIISQETADALYSMIHPNGSRYIENAEFSTQFFNAFRKHQSVFTEITNEYNEVTGQFETYVRIANYSNGANDLMRVVRSHSTENIRFIKAFYANENLKGIMNQNEIDQLFSKDAAGNYENAEKILDLVNNLKSGDRVGVSVLEIYGFNRVMNSDWFNNPSINMKIKSIESFLRTYLNENRETTIQAINREPNRKNNRFSIFDKRKAIEYTSVPNTLRSFLNKINKLGNYSNDIIVSKKKEIINDVRMSDVYSILGKVGIKVDKNKFNKAIELSIVQDGGFANSNIGIIIKNLIGIIDAVDKLDAKELDKISDADILNRDANISDEMKNSMKSIAAKYFDICKVLSAETEGNISSGVYSNGKMRYTYIQPSYITNFMNKLGGLDNSITQKEFINEHFNKPQFVTSGSSRFKNRWLEDIANNEGCIDLRHNQNISYNQTAYKEMTGPMYLASIFHNYFGCNETTILGSGINATEREYAYFRVPIMSNKPAAEYIKFIKYNIDEIANDSINILDQEVTRIIHALKCINDMCFKKDDGSFEFYMDKARDFFDIDFEAIYKKDKALFNKIYDYANSSKAEFDFTLSDLKKIIKLKSKNGNASATSFKALEFINNIISKCKDDDINDIVNTILDSINKYGFIATGSQSNSISSEFKKYMDSMYDKSLEEWIAKGILNPQINVNEDNKFISITFPHLGSAISPIIINYNREQAMILTDKGRTKFNDTVNSILYSYGMNQVNDPDLFYKFRQLYTENENPSALDIASLLGNRDNSHMFTDENLAKIKEVFDFVSDEANGGISREDVLSDEDSVNILKMLGFTDYQLSEGAISDFKDKKNITLNELISYSRSRKTTKIMKDRIINLIRSKGEFYASADSGNRYGAGFDKLREFFYNDWFATYNIINLTSSDVSFFKDYVDFQKRNAQQHSPSIKLDKKATLPNSLRPVSDGKHRLVILEDFNGKDFKSDLVITIENVFKDKLKQVEKLYREQYEVNGSLSSEHEEELARAIEAYKVNSKWIVKQFRDKIDLTDGQAYSCPTSYRKKMLMTGKWNKEYEDAFQTIKKHESNKGLKDIYDELSNIRLLCQPLKPFTYGQVDSSNGDMNQPFQVKDSEYMIFLAGEILEGEGKGKPNLLEAIYRVMEESHYDKNGDYKTDGIDTVAFHSCVKIGASSVLSLKDMEYKNTDELVDALRSRIYTDDNGKLDYNHDVVHELDYDDYGIQQEVPAHYADHWQQMSSQSRILVYADAPDEYTYWDGTNFVKENADNAIDQYQKNVAEKITRSIARVRNELGLDKLDKSNPKTIKAFNQKISDILQETIGGNNEKFSEDLMDAIKLDVNGNFRRSLNDEAISSRVQQLLNAYIRKSVNKTKLSGGPVVQVSCFGLSDKLHLRFRGKDGNIMLSESEFNEKGYDSSKPLVVTNKETGEQKSYATFKEYDEDFRHSIAYLEAYAPIPSEAVREILTVTENGKKKLLTYDEAAERGIISQEVADDLSKIIGVRIPTEDAYSMLPIKVIGFLPSFAGEGIVLSKEITKLTGADFDIDKLFVTNKNVNFTRRSVDFTSESSLGFRKGLLKEAGEKAESKYQKNPQKFNNQVGAFITDDKKAEFRYLLKMMLSDINGDRIEDYDDLSAGDLMYLLCEPYINDYGVLSKEGSVKGKDRALALNRVNAGFVIKKIKDDLKGKVYYNKVVETAVKTILENRHALFTAITRNFDKRKKNADNRSNEELDNEIFDFQWMALTDPATLPKMLNPGSFEPQKKIARIKTIKLTCDTDSNEFKTKLDSFFSKNVSNLTLYEKLSKLDIDQLDELLSLNINDNHNIMFINSQIYFFEQNMSAAKLIGTFANNNIAHTILQRQNIRYYNTSGANGSSINFSLNGHSIVSYSGDINKATKLDGVLDMSLQYISKNIAGFLAASVDAAKDPVLNFLNLNSITVGPMMTLIRLGFDVNTASIFMSQDIITELINRFNLETATGGHTNVSSTINSMLEEIHNEVAPNEKEWINKIKNNLSADIPMDLMFNAIGSYSKSGDIIEYRKNDGSKGSISKNLYNARILLLFQHIMTLAKDVRDMTEQCRFNSMAYAVGPNISNSQLRRDSVDEFYERYTKGRESDNNLSPVNFLINTKSPHPNDIKLGNYNGINRDPENDQRIISHDRILSAYYYDIYGDYDSKSIHGDNISASTEIGLERELMSSLGFVDYNHIYERLIKKFKAVSKYGLDDSEINRIKSEFVFYALSKGFKSLDENDNIINSKAGFYLSQGEKAELLNTFPALWESYINDASNGKFSANTNYALMVLGKYFVIEGKNEYNKDFDCLNVATSNFSPEALQEFKMALDILSDIDSDGRSMVMNLWRYTMLRSGGHFNKNTSFHLFSTEFIERVPEYLDALRSIDETLDEDDIDRFFEQYIRNHNSNDDFRVVREIWKGQKSAFAEIKDIHFIYNEDGYGNRDYTGEIRVDFESIGGDISKLNLLSISNNEPLEGDSLIYEDNAYAKNVCPYLKYKGRLYKLKNVESFSRSNGSIVYERITSLGKRNVFVEYDANALSYLNSIYSHDTGVTRSFSHLLTYQIYDLKMEKLYDDIINGIKTILFASEDDIINYTDYFLSLIQNLVGLVRPENIIDSYNYFNYNIQNNEEFRRTYTEKMFEWQELREKIC